MPTGYSLERSPICTFLDASFSPTIAHLEILSPSWSADQLTAVTSGKLIKSIKSLVISGGWIDNDRARSLIAAKKALSHLESITIRAQLDDATAKKLAALANATVIPQDHDTTESFHFRYTATME